MEGPRLVSHWFITPEGSIYEVGGGIRDIE